MDQDLLVAAVILAVALVKQVDITIRKILKLISKTLTNFHESFPFYEVEEVDYETLQI